MSVERGSTLFCIHTRALRNPRLINNLSYMTNKKSNEELQNRREFFKKAAKAALPVVGAVVLANQIFAQSHSAFRSSINPIFGGCSDCTGHCATCQDSCYGSCTGTCDNTCSGTCDGSNSAGNPNTSCSYSCSGSCAGGCSGTCYRTCSRSCSGYTYN